MDTYYYAIVDGNDVLCVDQVGEHHSYDRQTVTESEVAVLASSYPEVIYFAV